MVFIQLTIPLHLGCRSLATQTLGRAYPCGIYSAYNLGLTSGVVNRTNTAGVGSAERLCGHGAVTTQALGRAYP